jgi:hypothetical protein
MKLFEGRKRRKVKRPEKMIEYIHTCYEGIDKCMGCVSAGYNQACDDWEKFLSNEKRRFSPDGEEIKSGTKK